MKLTVYREPTYGLWFSVTARFAYQWRVICWSLGGVNLYLSLFNVHGRYKKLARRVGRDGPPAAVVELRAVDSHRSTADNHSVPLTLHSTGSVCNDVINSSPGTIIGYQL